MSTTFLKSLLEKHLLLIQKKYKVLEKIGEGSFSEVLKCQERENGIYYAAKRLKKIYQNMSEILESPEVIAMRKISHHSNILYMVESHCLKPLFPGANEVDQIIKIHAILGTPHARLVAKFRRHKSRNCEYFFPTNGGSGITNLLPQVTETGRDVLKLMLIYDPENRSNVKRLLEHRYFNDLRENESPRQLNIIMPSNSSHDTYQWRNPVLLSYITSERRRNIKPSSTRRLKFQGEDLSKVPRIIASSPNARLSLSNESNTSKISKSGKSNVTINNDSKQLERTSGTANISSITKRQATLENSGRSIKNCMSEITDTSGSRLPNIKHNSKTILSKEMNMNSLNIPAKYGLPALDAQYGFNKIETFNQNCRQKIHYNQKAMDTRYENKQYNSFLPHISHKFAGCDHLAIDSTGSTPNQNYNKNTYVQNNKLYRTRLATIKEQPIPDLMARKLSYINSPIMKSPAKKIAKHEMLTSPKLCTIATKKLKASPRRIYERRYKYGIK